MDYSIIIIVAAVVVFVIGRRLVGARKGARYSARSIFLRPVIYLILSVVLVIGLQLIQTAIVAVSVVIGLFIGTLLGKRSNIFEKDGKIMYRRSNEVMVIWIVAFVIRLIIGFYTDPALLGVITGSVSSNAISLMSIIAASSSSSPLILIADILLAFSAGLLFGEALVLYRNFNSRYAKTKI